MADIPVITGNFPDGTPFAFTLNGAATQRQMERLIELTGILAKRATNPKKDPEQLAQIEALKNNTVEVNKNTDANKANTKETINFQDALLNLSTVTNIARGNLTTAFNGINKPAAAVAAAMGGMVGQLFDYSNQLGQAMQRGVSGGIMDFAIAAKTGGVTLAQFSKALDESGGSFAMLGNGATDGAKQFGSLVSEVRYATASVGNLGLSNEQLATLTAQQVKVAVAQGFKGRSANAQVIENTKVFSEELDNLANRTGRSVLELAAAAQKLALDPVVSNFVATARSGGKAVSQAINSYAASLEGLFGKSGEQLRTDALQNALAGLPLTMTEAGKNLQLASASVYGELQNQANRAAAGQSISEEDTKRLRELVLREVDARRTELTYMAQIKGTAGDAAKQLLGLAAEARQYNTAEGAKRRAEDKAAQAFVASTNQLRANLQQLSIPILNLLNGVNWTLLTNILRGFTATLEVLMTPFSILGKILSDTGLGSVVGGLLGLVAVVSLVSAGFTLFKNTLNTLSAVIQKHAFAIGASTPKSVVLGDYSKPGGYTKGGPTSDSRAGRLGSILSNNALMAAGIGTTMLGGALSMAGDNKLQEDAESTWGKIASVGGKILEFAGIAAALAPVVKMAIDGFASFRLGMSLVTAFLSKQMLTALASFRSGLLAGKAGDALGSLAGAGGPGRFGKFGKLAAGGTLLAGGLSMMNLSDIESQRAAGDITDRQANKESAATVGAFGGGAAGAAMGAGFGAAFGGIGAIPGALIGGILGSVLGGAGGYGAAHVLTEDPGTGVSKDIKDTQTSAIDTNNMKDSESTKQLTLLNKNLETLVASSDANLMVNGKIASISDNNSRYLRGATFGSA
jgi:hypothetical protein